MGGPPWALFAVAPWTGVDEGIVEPYAKQAGQAPWGSLIPEGDLLLFMFLVAGIVGGFVLGYHWRGLFGPKEGGDGG